MEIYITKGVQQIGPFSEDEILLQLDSGEIDPSTLSWHEGCADWFPLSQLVSKPTPIVPPPIVPPPIVPPPIVPPPIVPPPIVPPPIVPPPIVPPPVVPPPVA